MPPKLKVFQSPDKKYHRLGTNDTLAFPARCILAAPVSFGKNSCMLNLVAREPGGYDRHIVVHHCLGSAKPVRKGPFSLNSSKE